MSPWAKAFSSLSRAKDASKPAIEDSPSLIARANEDALGSLGRYYDAKAGESFNGGRYETIRQLGMGRYSHVWLAKDLQQKSYVALKILTNDCYGTNHDIFEIEILSEITRQQAQSTDAHNGHLLGLLDVFRLSDSRHECIVMPVLGCSLSAQSRRFPGNRVPTRVMKQITRQLLVGLALLHNKCKVVHTDLQPSNICFVIAPHEIERMAAGETAEEVTAKSTENDPGTIKIIDFGVASWIDKHLSDNVQPEHLRAPEVILGAPWGPPIDIWSLGCLVIEFVKGHVAFNGAASSKGTWTSNDDHLAQYMEVLGPMPAELLQRGTKTHDYFDSKGSLLRIPDLEHSSLKEIVDGSEGVFQRPSDMSAEDATLFVDFLQGALALDPDLRRSADELLRHAWLQDS